MKPAPTPHIAYVLNSFGTTSETFIYEEMGSLLDGGVRLSLFHGRCQAEDAGHSTLQRVRSEVRRYPMAETGRGHEVLALLRWLLQAPLRTLKVLAQALRSPHRWIFWATLAPAWRARRLGCQRFHAHFADANALHAMAMAAWCGLPYSLTLHRYDLFEPVLDAASLQALLRAACPVITISEFNRRHLSQHFGLRPEDIRLVHCGIDLKRYAYAFLPRAPQQRFELLSVGRLVKEKAYERLIEAVALLKAQGRQLRLRIVGAGRLEDSLRAQLQQLGLQAEVELLGARSAEQVLALHRESHAFVSSSRVEGLPVAGIEALALGTPMVATAIYGLPELIQDGDSGLLVPPEDPAALALAVARLMDDEALRLRLSAQGRRHVEREFERSSCTQQLLIGWRSAHA